MVKSIAEFWEIVNPGDPDSCWEWPGSKRKDGYGGTRFEGRKMSTHRIAWMLTNGPIGAGLFVLHRCDNPPCCNPAHLFVGTAGENTRDSVAKGRARVAPTGDAHWSRQQRVAWLRTEDSWRSCKWCGLRFRLRRPSDPQRYCSSSHAMHDRHARRLDLERGSLSGIRRSKPLKRTALKSPTLEAIQAWERKPRRALPRGERPAQKGRRAKREEAAWQLGRALVIERSGGFCEGPQVVGVHPTGKHSGHHVHHVLSRGRGGGHDPENLLHLCTDLHRHAHARPAWAQSVGLLASRGPERGVVSEPS